MSGCGAILTKEIIEKIGGEQDERQSVGQPLASELGGHLHKSERTKLHERARRAANREVAV
jgi:hypothetical protein